MTRRRSPWTLAVGLMLAASGHTAFAQAAPAPVPAPVSAPAAEAPPTMPPPPPPPQAPPPNLPPPPVKGGPAGVVAVINGQRITRTELEQTALQTAGEQALKELIVSTLVDQAAKKQGVTVTPAALNARMAELEREVNSGYPGGFAAYVQSQGSLAALQSNVRLDMLAVALANQGKPAVHRVHIHYLVVLTTNPNGAANIKPHTPAEAKAIIAKAQAALKAGQSFESVVAKYSEDPGKNTGGDLLGQDGKPMLIGPESAGQLDPAFVHAALALKPGEVTPTPVYSPQFGYFLLKAVSTSEHPINVETKKTDEPLYFQAAQADDRTAAQAYLRTLLQTAKITNYYFP